MPDRIKAVIKAKEGTTSYELLNFNRHFTSKFKYFSSTSTSSWLLRLLNELLDYVKKCLIKYNLLFVKKNFIWMFIFLDK